MGIKGRLNQGPLEARMELWRKRFREFSSGRWTVEQFCKQVGVTSATFYYWKKKLAEADHVTPASFRPVSDHRVSVSRKNRKGEDAPGRFMPVRIARAAVVSGDVVIRLPSGAQVQIPTSASEVIATVIAQVYGLSDRATTEVA